MSTTKRPDYPNAIHHVMARGVAKQKIFTDDNDRYYFLNKLANCLEQRKATCIAWVLMPNHFHLLVQRTTEPIHKIMQSFLTSYAAHYNHRHSRPGHLFQNRFKSILCQEDRYFFTLIKYIHQNPIRAKLVKDLQELNVFPWSSHIALVNKHIHNWYNSSAILEEFGNDQITALKNYHNFMQSSLNEQETAYARHGTIMKTDQAEWKNSALLTEKEKERADVGILGDKYFIRHALQQCHTDSDSNNEPFLFEEIVDCASSIFNIPQKSIFTSRRQAEVLQARSLICAWSFDEFGRSAIEIALHLGVNRTTVYRLINNGRKLIHSNHKLEYKNCK